MQAGLKAELEAQMPLEPARPPAPETPEHTRAGIQVEQAAQVRLAGAEAGAVLNLSLKKLARKTHLVARGGRTTRSTMQHALERRGCGGAPKLSKQDHTASRHQALVVLGLKGTIRERDDPERWLQLVKPHA